MTPIRSLSFTVAIGERLRPPSEAFIRAVQNVEIERDLTQASMLRITAGFGVDEQGKGWTTVDEEAFPSKMRISVHATAAPNGSTPLFSGFVVDVKPRPSSRPGNSTVEIVAMDHHLLLQEEPEKKNWGRVSDLAVAQTAIGRYQQQGLVGDTEGVPTPSARNGKAVNTIQARTDATLLAKLAKRNGFEFYIAPGLPGDPSVAHFHPPRLSAKPQKPPLSVNLGITTNVAQFSLTDNHTIASALTGRGLDARTLKPFGVTGSKPKQVLGSSPIAPGKTAVLVGSGLADPAELQRSIQAQVDRSHWAISATGQTTATRYGGLLRPGVPVLVRGVGKTYAGTYYVTRVTYMLSSQEISQHFTLGRNATGLEGGEGYVDG